jgi:hypothetical protein
LVQWPNAVPFAFGLRTRAVSAPICFALSIHSDSLMRDRAEYGS